MTIDFWGKDLKVSCGWLRRGDAQTPAALPDHTRRAVYGLWSFGNGLHTASVSRLTFYCFDRDLVTLPLSSFDLLSQVALLSPLHF
jgi:hypothetical protein